MATLRELLGESYKEGMTLAEAEKEKSKKNIKNLKFFSVDRLKFLKRYSILILGMSNFAHFVSILSINRQMIERYKAYFPKSFEIFMEILNL